MVEPWGVEPQTPTMPLWSGLSSMRGILQTEEFYSSFETQLKSLSTYKSLDCTCQNRFSGVD